MFPKNGEGFWFHYWFWWPGEMTIWDPQDPSKNIGNMWLGMKGTWRIPSRDPTDPSKNIGNMWVGDEGNLADPKPGSAGS